MRVKKCLAMLLVFVMLAGFLPGLVLATDGVSIQVTEQPQSQSVKIGDRFTLRVAGEVSGKLTGAASTALTIFDDAITDKVNQTMQWSTTEAVGTNGSSALTAKLYGDATNPWVGRMLFSEAQDWSAYSDGYLTLDAAASGWVGTIRVAVLTGTDLWSAADWKTVKVAEISAGTDGAYTTYTVPISSFGEDLRAIKAISFFSGSGSNTTYLDNIAIVVPGEDYTPTLNYQWYSCADADKTDAAVIEGATEATLPGSAEAAGTYYTFCRLSAEGADSVDSAVAVVTIAENEEPAASYYYFKDSFHGTISNTTANLVDTVEKESGTASWKITNTYTDNILTVSAVPALNAENLAYATLKFSLKQAAGGGSLKISVGNQVSGWKNYLATFAVTPDFTNTDWQEISIPLNAFGTVAKYQWGETDTITLDVTALKVFAVNVGLWGGTAGVWLDNVRIEIDEPQPTPTITIDTQPTNLTVTQNDAAAFTVAASVSDTSAPSYQWYACTDAAKTDAAPIDAATAATYAPPTDAIGTFYYFCRVSAEGAEPADSAVVTLVVKEAPQPTGDYYYFNDSFNGIISNTTANSIDTDEKANGTASWRITNTYTDNLLTVATLPAITADNRANATLKFSLKQAAGGGSLKISVGNQVSGWKNYLATFAVTPDFTNTDWQEISIPLNAFGTVAKYQWGETDTITLDVTALKVFAVNVGLWGGTAGVWLDNVRIEIDEPQPTPTITIDTQPTNLTVTQNDAAAFTVAASVSDTSAPSYQWYACKDAAKTDAAPIDEATAATYAPPTDATVDWDDSDVEQRAQRALAMATDGGIVLMHCFSGNSATAEALYTILPELQRQGYTFVTLSGLFAAKGITPQANNGVMYDNVFAAEKE